jgi:hypothetical protein
MRDDRRVVKQAGAVIVVTSTICLLSTACGRGSFGSVVLAIGLTLLMSVAVLIGLGLMFLARSTTTKALGAWVCLVGVSVVGGCLLSLPAGAAVNRADIAKAKQFCDLLRPELERHKAAKGAYPERLSEIRLPGLPPRLLDDRCYSTSSDGAYSFTISDPSGLMNGHRYESGSGTWYEWD